MEENNNNNGLLKPLIWWKKPAWLASLAAFIAAIAFSIFVFTAVSNKETLDAIEKNQAGIDELVGFVRDVERQQGQQGESDTVRNLYTLLCASEDPVRIKACEQLGQR